MRRKKTLCTTNHPSWNIDFDFVCRQSCTKRDKRRRLAGVGMWPAHHPSSGSPSRLLFSSSSLPINTSLQDSPMLGWMQPKIHWKEEAGVCFCFILLQFFFLGCNKFRFWVPPCPCLCASLSSSSLLLLLLLALALLLASYSSNPLS